MCAGLSDSPCLLFAFVRHAEMDSTTLRRNHHGAKILLSTSFKYLILHLKSEIIVIFFLLENN